MSSTTLRLAAILVGVAVAAVVALALRPAPAARGSLVVEAAAGDQRTSLGSMAIALHGRSGWTQLGRTKPVEVPLAPASVRLATSDLPPGRYDALRIGGALLSAPIQIDAGYVTPALAAWQRGAPAALYSGGREFNLGLQELAGRLVRLPDFQLRDQAGRSVTRASLTGRPLVLAAFHTTCHEACPLYTGLFLQLRRQLPASVRLVEVSTDPAVDSVEALRAYADAIGADWTFLTGTTEQLSAFWTPLGVRLSGADAHTELLAVVDEHGYVHRTESGVPAVGPNLPDPLAGQLNQQGRRDLAGHGDGWGAPAVLDAVRQLDRLTVPAWTGQVAPALALAKLNGGALSLSEYRGRPLVLNFWASYCGPCQAEMPLLAAAARQRAGVAFLLVDERDDAAAARSFWSRYGGGLDCGYDPDGAAGDAFGVGYYPVTVFLRRDGSVAGRVVGQLDRQVLDANLDAIA